MRCDTPTCGAASPTPGAAYMVSSMSLTSWTVLPVMFFTGAATLRVSARDI